MIPPFKYGPYDPFKYGPYDPFKYGIKRRKLR